MSSTSDKSTNPIKTELHWHVALYEVYLKGTNLCIGMVQGRHDKGEWEVYDSAQDLLTTVPTLEEGIVYLKLAYIAEEV